MKQQIRCNYPAFLDYVSRVVARRIDLGPIREAGGVGDSDMPTHPGARAMKAKAMRCKSLAGKGSKSISATDKEEIKGACAVVLATFGAFDSGVIPWIECFQAARAAVGMNHDRHSITDPTDPAKLPQSWGSEHPAVIAARRQTRARRLHYFRQCLFAAFGADPSRKRKAKLQSMLATLREIHRARAGEISSRDASGNALKFKLGKLRAYLAIGEETLTAQAQAACATPRRKPEIKSFADFKFSIA